MAISGPDCSHVLDGSVSEVRRLISINYIRKARKMTTVMFGIFILVGGFALAVFMGLVLYKDRGKGSAAR
jgi:t-SNARE complex subunit (syntaxin)